MNEEMIRRAAAILEREFGQDWQGIAQELGTENLRRRKPPPAGAFGKELTSFMAFPERGSGGDSQWRDRKSTRLNSSHI